MVESSLFGITAKEENVAIVVMLPRLVSTTIIMQMFFFFDGYFQNIFRRDGKTKMSESVVKVL